MLNLDDDKDKTQSFTHLKEGTVFSHYKIINKIGEGGMGEVFLAEDTQLNRKTALKFLSASLSADELFRKRFLREARSAGAINHPNIITVYEVSEFQDQIYIAMEYIDGDSLRTLIDKNMLNLLDIYNYAIQICEGLACVHSAGFVHRDIKPHNILVDKNNKIRILDFGLAKKRDDSALTKTGSTLGTIHYMSPEQAEGRDVDSRSDIFSFGIVLFEMLSGKVPFEKENLPATIYSIINDQTPILNSNFGELSLKMSNIIEKALEKKPEKRYGDLLSIKNELINELNELRMLSTSRRNSQEVEIQKNLEVKSLAVLYLKNLGLEEDEYLCYGITEDLIIDLSRIGSIRVTPMKLILPFKDKEINLSLIAEQLSVNLILDGTLHKSENLIKLNVRLVEIKSQKILWSNYWEESLENLPQLKKSLSDGISDFLDVSKTVMMAAQVGQPLANNAQAYDFYLKAKYLFDRKKDKYDVEQAIHLYGLALEKEPDFLSARIGLAEINIYNGLVDIAEKELGIALEHSEKSKWASEMAGIKKLLAQLYLQKSDWNLAYKYGIEALELEKEINNLSGEASVLSILISILQPQGKYDEIFKYYDRVLEINHHQQDKEKVAEALKNMGTVYLRKGEYDNAIQLYEEANELAKEENNFILQAACMSNMGNVNYFRGDLEQAYKYYEKSYNIADRIGDKALCARQISNMALVKLNNSEFDEGLKLLEDTADIFLVLNDRSNYALTLVNISQARLTVGDIKKSILAANKSLEISNEINNLIAQADALLCLSSAYSYSHDFERAIDFGLQALVVSSKNSNKRNISMSNLLLAKAYFHTENYKNAQQNADDAYNISREIGEKVIMFQAVAMQGAIQVAKGLYNTGIKQIETSLQNLLKIKNYDAMINTKAFLAYLIIRFSNNDFEVTRGKAFLEEAFQIANEKNIKISIKYINDLKNLLKLDRQE